MKSYFSLWQNKTTRQIKFKLRLMVNSFQEKCNGILKNALYKIVDVGVIQPRKEISKVNMKLKGRILESVTKSVSGFERNVAFSKWRV